MPEKIYKLRNRIEETASAGGMQITTPRSDSASRQSKAERAPAPSRRARTADAKRTVIMDAALEIFSRNGLHGSRIEQVAERADVSKTNLLYYFTSKETLYVAVLERMLKAWLEPLEALGPEQDPSEALSAYIRHKMQLSRTAPAASRLFCMEMLQGAPMLMPVLSGSLKRLVASKSAVLRAWAREGRIADIPPIHLIYTIWGVTQHYADFAAQIAAVSGATMEDRQFADKATDAVLAILLNGMLPRDPSRPAPTPLHSKEPLRA